MSRRSSWSFAAPLLALAMLFSLVATAVASMAPGPVVAPGLQGPEERLQTDTDGTAVISMNPATGVASFVRFPDRDQGPLLTGTSPEARSMAFFDQYGELFGVYSPRAELQLADTRQDIAGGTHLVYRQTYRGLPVFAADLRTHFDASGRLTAVNGTFIPDITTSVLPGLSAEQAATIAVNAVLDQLAAVPLRPVEAVETNLTVFRVGLIQGVPGPNVLAYEVTVANGADVREFVFVDAHKGTVIEQFTGIHQSLTREVYEVSLAPGTLKWQEGDPDPIPAGWAGGTAQQVTDWQNEIDGARETYNVFGSMTNGAWLSYDSADAVMKTVNNAASVGCPNASWNGVSTNYCTGVTGDDTVAHEWGHAYTEYTHNLIYAWQPGALNESYSDIWGEVVDLLNGRGTDSPGGLRSSDGAWCSTYDNASFPPTYRKDNTYRWLSGEDDPAFGAPIRDMWRPECHGDPGKVTSGSYTCSSGDGGGVHTNSGVPNHGFALLLDGGSYNGQTISGIGLTKASHIYWQAQQYYQNQASKFSDHADALEAACSDLLGTPLYEPVTTGPGTWGNPTPAIAQTDCDQLPKVALAVEFRTPASCDFEPLFDPDAPALCAGDLSPQSHLYQDFEAGLGAWTVAQVPSNPGTWNPRDWQVVSDLPRERPGSAAYGPDPVVGDCASDLDNGIIVLQSPVIAVPVAAAAPVRLAFDHLVSMELGWDGGNLKASVNGGAYNLVPASAFTFNDYKRTLNSAASGNDNPMAGQAAFTGGDEGDVSSAWGQSQIDLAAIGVDPGDTVQFRWELGTDGCNGWDGWYVDDVRLYTCEACAAPGQVSGLSIVALDSTSLRLEWAAVPGASEYQVWSAADEPYFDPTGLDCAVPGPYSCTVTADTTYEADQLGGVDDNYAYLVRAVSSCGTGPFSDRRGEFDFGLVSGTP